LYFINVSRVIARYSVREAGESRLLHYGILIREKRYVHCADVTVYNVRVLSPSIFVFAKRVIRMESKGTILQHQSSKAKDSEQVQQLKAQRAIYLEL
jgi:hypothetical protein